ncbi:hypothetical protein RDI58_030349 [Solanum bulbocastanum]|uniref:Uncharacterized protein n=1 Tax=Solanum bulbocastanum TaxID=147425 RepID=A0AAN8XXY9_SOLBU
MKVPYYRIPSKANLMMAAYLSKKTMAPIIGWGTPLSKGLQVLMILLHDDSTFLDMSPFSNLLRSSGL